jgi:hypothetical protein
MRAKFFHSLLMLVMVLGVSALAYGQADTTYNNFVGVVQFSGFSAGGTADVTGVLSNFSDQTNRYFANDIAVNDVVWDNAGNRWQVAVVNSSNLLQADVDLTDINTTGGTPFGTGFVTRESSLGFSMFPPDNSTGISQQLKSRVESHNWLKLNKYLVDNPGGGGGDTMSVMRPYDAGEGFYCYCTPGVSVTSGAAGLYTVSIPDSVDVNHLYVQFTNAGTDFTGGGEAVITVQWAGAGSDFNQGYPSAILPDVKIIDSSGTQREPADVSVTVSTTAPSGGNTVTTIANINGVGTPVSVRLGY